MYTGGSRGLEMKDDVRRGINLEIVQKINQANDQKSRMEAVTFIETCHPLNVDCGLVVEITDSVNKLFSEIKEDEIDGRSGAQLLLDVGGPVVEGQSGGRGNGHIFDNILTKENKEKMQRVFDKQWGQNQILK